MSAIRTALTFRASSIGDCLMGAYFLENVHAAYPDARCGIVIGSRARMIRELMRDYPWIEVIEVNRRKPRTILRLIREWRGSDLVLTQYTGKGGSFSLPSKIIARLLARHGGLMGFTDAFWGNRFLYDTLVPFSASSATAELERLALGAAGIPVASPYPKLAHAAPQTGDRPYLVVHLFAGNASRGLSPAYQKELVHTLALAFGERYSLFLTGAAEDAENAETAAAGTCAEVRAGKIPLYELPAFLAGAACVVSVDTGVAHIAAQSGAKLLVLRTCLGPAWWLPGQYGSGVPLRVYTNPAHTVQNHPKGDYPSCINGIPVTEIIESLSKTLV